MRNDISLREDELLYSWLLRYAAANCLSMRWIIKNYIKPGAADHSARSLIRYDSFMPLQKLLRELGHTDYFLKASIYPFLASLLKEYQQADIISACFVNDRPNLVSAAKNYIPVLKYCPECMKESRYYRRAHQLLGVTACWKHHVKLLEYHGMLGRELEENFAVDAESAADKEISYAQFAKDFMDTGFQTSAESLAKLVNRRENISAEKLINLLWQKYKTIDNLAGHITNDKPVITNDMSHLFLKRNGWNKITPSDTNAAAFRKVFDTESNGEYELLSDYDNLDMNSQISVLHKPCGRKYEISAKGFIKYGRRCTCGRNDLHSIEQLGFKVLSYTDSVSPVTLQCPVCGEPFTICRVDQIRKYPYCRNCRQYAENIRRRTGVDVDYKDAGRLHKAVYDELKEKHWIRFEDTDLSKEDYLLGILSCKDIVPLIRRMDIYTLKDVDIDISEVINECFLSKNGEITGYYAGSYLIDGSRQIIMTTRISRQFVFTFHGRKYTVLPCRNQINRNTWQNYQMLSFIKSKHCRPSVYSRLKMHCTDAGITQEWLTAHISDAQGQAKIINIYKSSLRSNA